ncbi:MAG TPA: hypothetical protein VGD78_18025 [Chthoniobacterales bacterium]
MRSRFFSRATRVAIAGLAVCAAVSFTSGESADPALRPSKPANAPRPAEALLQQALANARAVDAARQPLERADVRSSTPPYDPGGRKSALLPDPEGFPGGPRAEPTQTPETLAAPRRPTARPVAASAPVQVQDPRMAVAGEIPDPSAYEPTALTVSRVFVTPGTDEGEARKVAMSVPVYYETRLLGMEKDKQRAAARLLEKLADFQKRVVAMQKEGAVLLTEWNEIVDASVPKALLLADSPTLVQNQGADKVNRPDEPPGFEAGKGALVQLKATESGK